MIQFHGQKTHTHPGPPVFPTCVFPLLFSLKHPPRPWWSRCKDGWLADPAQQDKPGKSEASCCTQESEGDRKIDVENRVVDFVNKIWVFWVSRWWLKRGNFLSKYHAFGWKVTFNIFEGWFRKSNIFFHVHLGSLGRWWSNLTSLHTFHSWVGEKPPTRCGLWGGLALSSKKIW